MARNTYSNHNEDPVTVSLEKDIYYKDCLSHQQVSDEITVHATDVAILTYK